MKKLLKNLIATVVGLFILFFSLGCFALIGNADNKIAGSIAAGLFFLTGLAVLPIRKKHLLEGKKVLKACIFAAAIFVGMVSLGLSYDTAPGNQNTSIAEEEKKDSFGGMARGAKIVPTSKRKQSEKETPEPTKAPEATAAPEPTAASESKEAPEPTATPEPAASSEAQKPAEAAGFDYASIPEYTGSPYTVVNDNVPFFADEDLSAASFENYSKLDKMGRCSAAYACVGRDIMPTEDRGAIGEVRPTGWHTVKYNGIIDGNYLYNRCHLIGYQLTGENANEQNLITGTRYMNVQGMEPFEDMTAEYVEETDHHVLYRVTPIFVGDELLARGVLMEAKSVEDDGAGILFNVFCYNVQPDVIINYANGDSALTEEAEARLAAAASVPTPTPTPTPTPEVKSEPAADPPETSDGYVANSNTGKFHHVWCKSVKQMKEKNKVYISVRDEAVNSGYKPCQNCNP